MRLNRLQQSQNCHGHETLVCFPEKSEIQPPWEFSLFSRCSANGKDLVVLETLILDLVTCRSDLVLGKGVDG